MKVTFDEIRKLREILDENRIEHEALAAQARILREHCRAVRQRCVLTKTPVHNGATEFTQQDSHLSAV